MPLRGEDRRKYDRRNYLRRKHQRQTKERMVLLATRVPESWMNRIQRMTAEAIALGNAPWRTNTDTIRALLVAGFEGLKDRSESLEQEFLPQLRLQEQITSLDRSRRTSETMFAMAKQNIDSLLAIKTKNSDETATQYYTSAIQQARELAPTVWKEWLIDQLEKTFPALAKRERAGAVPGITLRKRKHR